MAETRTIELNIVDNANQTQQQFENLRQQIAKTTQEVDELTQAYGENSQEVTEAKGRLNELNTSYKELNKSATDTGATFADVYGEMQPLTTRMGEAEDRLYELALAGQTATQEYKDLLAATQNYLRTQQQVDLQVEAGSMPMAQKLTTAVGGVAGGFAIAEGAIALFGVESQKMQETMLKLNALMSIMGGVVAINEAIPVFQNMGTAAKNALANIRTGVAATGIGVLVLAVGALVAYWDDIKKAVVGVGKEQEKLNKAAEKKAAASKMSFEFSQAEENQLRLQGKSEKEILKIRIGKLNTSIKDEEARIKGLELTSKLEIDAAKRNKEIAKTIIKFWVEGLAAMVRWLVAPIDLMLISAKKLGDLLGFDTSAISSINAEISKFTEMASEWGSKLLFDPAQMQNDANKTLNEAKLGLAQMKSERDGFLIELKASDKASTQSQIDNQKEIIDLDKENRDKRIALMEDGYAKEKLIAEAKAKDAKDDLEKRNKEGIIKATEYAEAQKLIDETLQKDLQGITDKYNKIEYDKQQAANAERIKQEDEQFNALEKLRNSKRDQELLELAQSYDAKFAAAEGNAILEKALTEQFNKEQTDIIRRYKKEQDDIDKENTEKEIARKNELRQKTLELAGNSFAALSELAGSFNAKNEAQAKKQFQVQKAFNLAAAITNTAMAVTGALTAGGNPIKLATGMQFVEAGIAATVGAANIIKISNSKFGGGANSGGGGNDTNVPTAAPMTANFNTIGSSGINQLAQLQQTPTQAYVVSTEVTSAQALDRNRVQNATL